jgi:hypothetical protein
MCTGAAGTAAGRPHLPLHATALLQPAVTQPAFCLSPARAPLHPSCLLPSSPATWYTTTCLCEARPTTTGDREAMRWQEPTAGCTCIKQGCFKSAASSSNTGRANQCAIQNPWLQRHHCQRRSCHQCSLPAFRQNIHPRMQGRICQPQPSHHIPPPPATVTDTH